MDLGDVLVALGLDLQVLQGAVNQVYLRSPALQRVDGPDGLYHLDLAVPLLEVREECLDVLPFRMGLHLQGDLYVGTAPDPLLFDAWVRLHPDVAEDDDGLPVGVLVAGDVESVTPEGARGAVADAFAPDGTVGQALAAMQLPLFGELLTSVTAIFTPPVDPDAEVAVVPGDWAVALRLGEPAELPRPVHDVRGYDDDAEVVLVSDGAVTTVPALVATVAHAGASPELPGSPSIVRPASGLQLITAKAAFDRRLANEQAAVEGSEVEGLTIDRMELEAVDGGITVDGAAHQTGADVTFVGTLVAHYVGGTGGTLEIKPAVDTDVDTAWWVDLLSVVAALVPGIGWTLGAVFIWGPEDAAPGTVDSTLEEKFETALRAIGDQLALGFGVTAPEGGDAIPSGAYLHDQWIFDGNLAVSVVAFLGYNPAEIAGVFYDEAYLILPKKLPRKQAKKPVRSVEEIVLSTGQTLKPWQAARLVADGVVDIPRHHAVRNPLAKEGIFLRSDPNDDPRDNLVR